MAGKRIDIGGRLHSTATGNVVAGANEIYDDDLQKSQAEINAAIQGAIDGKNIDSGDVVKVEQYDNSKRLVVRDIKNNVINGIVPSTDTSRAWEQGKDDAIPTLKLVKDKIGEIDVSSQISGKADKSEMSVSSNGDKTTITLKSGTSAEVLNAHQDISGKLDNPSGGSVGQVLTKTANGVAWEDASGGVVEETDPVFSASPAAGITDNDIDTWNEKQEAISDLSTIRSGAAAGATAYQKPQGGIPASDLAEGIIPSTVSELYNDSGYQTASDVDTAIANETYTKEQINNMVTTPDQEYVTVGSYSSLPSVGAADTIYRVANWDGTAVDTSKYAEYAWDGNLYQLLSVKTSITDGIVGYYVCSTAAATAAKVVTAPGYTLPATGGAVKIKMTNANTAASGITLNIGGTGAKPLMYDGEAVSANNTWEDGETVEVYYDGTNYHANNVAGGGGGKFLTGEKVKDVAIDDEPTAGSENLVKSGGLTSWARKISPFLEDKITPYQTSAGWSLNTDGSCSSNSNAKIVKYRVTEGDCMHIKLSKDNDGVYQFQDDATVPSATNTHLVGKPIGNSVDSLIVVPAGATFLIVSQNNSNNYNEVKKVYNQIDGQPTVNSKGLISSDAVFRSINGAGYTAILSGNNGSLINNFSITGTSIIIKDEGFCVSIKDTRTTGSNKIITRGIVGYVSSTDGDERSFTFTVTEVSAHRNFLCLDITKLIYNQRVGFHDALTIETDEIENPDNKVVLALAYRGEIYPINSSLQYVALVEAGPSEIFLIGNGGKSIHKSITVTTSSIIIDQDGFEVVRKQGEYIKTVGYVGYVRGTDESTTYTMTAHDTTKKIAYVVDLRTLNGTTRTAFSVAIKTIDYTNQSQFLDLQNYVVLAVNYKNDKTLYPIALKEAVILNNLDRIKQLEDSEPQIDNSTFNLKSFEPEFYAYLNGRNNNASGEGTSWYKRFCITHISDIHRFDTLFTEAIKVSKNKANIILNTGDEGNGYNDTSRNTAIQWFNDTVNVVTGTNSGNIPYIGAKGNHDVCGITRQDYRDTIGNLIESYSSNFVWGNTDGGYGYRDIAITNMGTFRIILLDPFDYPDGSFPNTRGFMSATFSQNQIDWLIETLVSAANSGYHVITMMHYSFGDNSLSFNEDKAKPDATFYQDPFMIPDIIDAIQNKSSLNKTYSDSKNIENIVINRDFSSVGNLDFVCHLFGHIHSKNEHWCQKTDGSKVYDILMLGEAALGTYGNALNKVYRNPGTINEIEFSMLEIDTIEKTIYRVSYGAYLKYDGSNSVTNRTTKFQYRKQS